MKRKLVSRHQLIQHRNQVSLEQEISDLKSEVTGLSQKLECLIAEISLQRIQDKEDSVDVGDRGASVGKNRTGGRSKEYNFQRGWGVEIQKSSFVYFVLCPAANAVKIGYSINLKSRMSSLQTGNPERLQLITWMPGGRTEESILHDFFEEYRVIGEWFNYTGDLKKYISAVSAYSPGTFSLDPTEWKQDMKPKKPAIAFDRSVQNLRLLESADLYLNYALPQPSIYGEIEEAPERSQIKEKAKQKTKRQSAHKPLKEKTAQKALPTPKAEPRGMKMLSPVNGVYQ